MVRSPFARQNHLQKPWHKCRQKTDGWLRLNTGTREWLDHRQTEDLYFPQYLYDPWIAGCASWLHAAKSSSLSCSGDFRFLMWVRGKATLRHFDRSWQLFGTLLVRGNSSDMTLYISTNFSGCDRGSTSKPLHLVNFQCASFFRVWLSITLSEYATLLTPASIDGCFLAEQYAENEDTYCG